MSSFNSWLFLGSLVFQAAALVFSLRMLRAARYRAPWAVLSVAFVFMSVYRALALVTAAGWAGSAVSREALSAAFSVLISVVLFAGLFWLRRLAEREESASDQRRAAEARMRSLVDNTPSVIFIKDRAGRHVLVNRPCAELVGARPEEIVGRTDHELAPREVADAFRADDEAIAASGQARTYEESFEQGGRRRTFLTTKFPLFDNDGNVTSVCGIATDVTELRSAQAAARESDERLRLALEAADMGIWEWHLGSNRIFWSPQVSRLLGLTDVVTETTTEFFSSLIHPEDRRPLWAASIAAVDDRRPYAFDYRVTTPAGEVRWLSDRGQAVYDADGRPVRLLGTVTDITERVAKERTLRESRERLDAALSASKTGTFRWDFRTNALTWDDNLDRLFGLAPGRTARSLDQFAALVHPDDRAAVVERCKRCRDLGEDFSMEFRVVWPDGSVHWLDDQGRTFLDEEGRPAYMTGACVDVTARERQAVELREQRDRIDFTLRSARIGQWDVDLTSGVMTCSAQCKANLGLPAEAALTYESLMGRIHPDDRAAVREARRRSVEGHTEYDVEYRVVWPDGSVHWLHARGRTIYDPATDRPLYRTGITIDITDRKRAEMALRDSEGRLRELADAMPQIVWTCRPDGQVDYYNRRWYEITGMPADDVHAGNQAWVPMLHPDDARACLALIESGVRTGLPYQFEYRLRDRQTGTYRWYLGRTIPVKDGEGRVVRWIGTGTDIHDQKVAERALTAAREEAERANRTKDEFLAALSHELRTPLAPVLLTTQMLEHDTTLPERVRADLASIRRSVEIETRLIDDLLDLTRVSRGKLLLHPVPTDVHDTLRHAIETCRDDTFVQKRLKLVIRLEAEGRWVSADPARLGQIFWNLIKNATKFTPEGGTITVATRDEEGKGIVVEVSDTGMGIEAAALPTIFDAFEQGGPHVTRRFGGLGLGLSICKALTDLHHGTLTAASEGPGRGATFTLTLPTIEAPAPVTVVRPVTPDVAAAAAARQLAPENCRSILLVEDHEPTGRVMSRLLSGFGYRVRWAVSISDALDAASSDRFDLVVSDIGLPDGTGHDLMEQLKERYDLRGVALSGYGMEQDLDRSARAGFVRHLTKPVTIEKLDAVIRDVCA